MYNAGMPKTIKQLSTLLEKGHINATDLPALKEVVDNFSLAVTEQVADLIDPSDDNDPIKQQFIPSVEELNITPLESADPIGDAVHETVKGIIHRYPDRCLFLPVQVCSVYCRFCFRRENVSQHDQTLTNDEREAAFHYIESHPEIWEVIITGGDPLILKPAMLQAMLQRICAIPHVMVIRIHTRIPMVDSVRINDEMLQALSIDKALFIAIHANHAKEFTEEAKNALHKLIHAGIPLISQTTLLKGINDNIEALRDLMRAFVSNRIKPYYLHHADLAKGTAHFRTSIADGQALMRQLQGSYSGLCQPTYVLDIPGGFGKVPIGPQYITRENDCLCTVTDYQGAVHTYAEE